MEEIMSNYEMWKKYEREAIEDFNREHPDKQVPVDVSKTAYIKNLLIGVGRSPEEFAREVHVRVVDTLNPLNWDLDNYIFIVNDKKYELLFRNREVRKL